MQLPPVSIPVALGPGDGRREGREGTPDGRAVDEILYFYQMDS